MFLGSRAEKSRKYGANTFRKPVGMMVYLVEEFADPVVSIGAKKSFLFDQPLEFSMWHQKRCVIKILLGLQKTKWRHSKDNSPYKWITQLTPRLMGKLGLKKWTWTNRTNRHLLNWKQLVRSSCHLRKLCFENWRCLWWTWWTTYFLRIVFYSRKFVFSDIFRALHKLTESSQSHSNAPHHTRKQCRDSSFDLLTTWERIYCWPLVF